jgi:hypothetical protein
MSDDRKKFAGRQILLTLVWIALFTVLGCAPTADVSQDAGIIKQEDLAYIACIDSREMDAVAEVIRRVLEKEGITVFIEGDLIWCVEVFPRDAEKARRILDSHSELKTSGMRVVYERTPVVPPNSRAKR